jgi:hypothetical protein
MAYTWTARDKADYIAKHQAGVSNLRCLDPDCANRRTGNRVLPDPPLHASGFPSTITLRCQTCSQTASYTTTLP